MWSGRRGGGGRVLKRVGKVVFVECTILFDGLIGARAG